MEHEGKEVMLESERHGGLSFAVKELADAELGYFAWPSAETLAQFLWENQELFEGNSVLEVTTPFLHSKIQPDHALDRCRSWSGWDHLREDQRNPRSLD